MPLLRNHLSRNSFSFLRPPFRPFQCQLSMAIACFNAASPDRLVPVCFVLCNFFGSFVTNSLMWNKASFITWDLLGQHSFVIEISI